MHTDFLSIGECMVEMAPLPATDTFRLSYAGDTLNTAWYVRRLRSDWNVQFMTCAGRDNLSDRMIAFLDGSDVGSDHIARSPDRTLGLYLIELADGERSFSYWRGQSAARLLASDPDRLSAAMAGARMIYFSGITLAILEGNGRRNLLAALATARAAGQTVAFDPNLRPRLWKNTDDMRGAIMDAAKVSDIVLPSFEDEADHFSDDTPAATADRYRDAGAHTVIVKNGPGDVVFLHGAQRGVQHTDPVAQVVDSTAAGDSFNAGFLTHFATTGEVADSIDVGAKVAGQVIGGRGALVDLVGI